MGRRKTRAKQQHFRPVIRSGKKTVYFIAFFRYPTPSKSRVYIFRPALVECRVAVLPAAAAPRLWEAHIVYSKLLYMYWQFALVLLSFSHNTAVVHGTYLFHSVVFFTYSFSQFLSIPHECWCTMFPRGRVLGRLRTLNATIAVMTLRVIN